MVSILIPVYNYSIIELVRELLEQCKVLDCKFEIIVLDDCSSDKEISITNQVFCKENQVSYFFSEPNLGNAGARNFLAEKAHYEWLLFLDADVLPVNKNFINNYLFALRTENSDVFSGDIVYDKQYKYKENNLRWKYGVRYEELSLRERVEKKYLNIKSANLFIKKELFLQLKFPEFKFKYGFEDTCFGLLLKESNIKALLLENPVYHNGLESNEVYLAKVEQSIQNLTELILNKQTLIFEIKIANVYSRLKSLKLEKLVCFLFKKVKRKVKSNLLSGNPNLFLFQFYKLGYLIELLAEEKISNNKFS